VKQQWLVKEEEKKRRVIVSDGEDLRRAMHPEQANESVRFVGGVELQYIRMVSVVARKAYIIVAVGETTPPKCAHDTVWAFTAKCTGAEQWLTIFVQGQVKKKRGGGSGVEVMSLGLRRQLLNTYSGMDRKGATRSTIWVSLGLGPCHATVPRALGPVQLSVATVAPLELVT
jgi:hypothetical protein